MARKTLTSQLGKFTLSKSLLMALVIILTVGKTTAATFTVSNTNDSGAGSLRQAVLDANAAAGADTIVFDPAIFSSAQTITLASVITIDAADNMPLTITGPGANLLTISGNNVTRIFQISAGRMCSMSDMTLTAGRVSGARGGAIRNYGTLNITNVVVTGNVTGGSGGGGGGVANESGGTLNVVKCLISNNQGFGTNTAGNIGGGIASIDGTVNISDSTITTNSASADGGGIAITRGTASISGSLVSSNQSLGNYGNYTGAGGILNSGATAITNSIIRDNVVMSSQDPNKGGDGGGILNGDTGQLTITNSTVIGNSCATTGGGIKNVPFQATSFLNITDSTISNNLCNSNNQNNVGGGLNIRGRNTTILRSTISGNTAAGSTGDGGGIAYGISASGISIINSTISENTAGRSYGGIYEQKLDGDTATSSTVNIISSTITNNTANGSVGGYGNEQSDSGATTFRNTIVAHNTAGSGTSPDLGGFLNSSGYNLFGDTTGATITGDTATNITGVDPNLAPLADNGGPTQTHAFAGPSAAIDHGNAGDLTTDQRGRPRPVDYPSVANANGSDGSDIGAFELQPRLLNLSTRGRVLTGDKVLIAGVIIIGNEPKRVIFRAIGDSMQVNGTPVAGRLTDPTLSLHDASGMQIAYNDNWGDAPEPERSDIQNSGLQPNDPKEPAILRTLAPGAYTAIVRGKAESTGIAVVEAYDLVPTSVARLANLSTRGFVDTGDNLMIGGAMVAGAGVDVVVRGLGPSLAVNGTPISDRLADPTLQLVNANGATIAENDNWQSDPANAMAVENANLAPANPMEAALRVTLPAGATTMLLRGVNGTTGIALVEIYEIPNGP